MVAVMSSDTGVVIYSSAYHQRFCELVIQEIWVKFGTEYGCSDTTIHKLRQQMVSRSVPHVLVRPPPNHFEKSTPVALQIPTTKAHGLTEVP